MKQSNVILWALVILFVGAITWLALTGRLEGLVNSLVDGYWNFYENIMRSLRR